MHFGACNTGIFSRALNRITSKIRYPLHLPAVLSNRNIVDDSSIELTANIFYDESTHPPGKLVEYIVQMVSSSGEHGISYKSLMDCCTKQFEENDFCEFDKDFSCAVDSAENDSKLFKLNFDNGSGRSESRRVASCIYLIDPQYRDLYFARISTGYEILCPWKNIDGSTNDAFLNSLRSKVLSTLMQKPGSSFRSLHAMLPMLSRSQMDLLLDMLVEAKDIYLRDITTIGNMSVTNPFDNCARVRSKKSFAYFALPFNFRRHPQ